MFYAYARVTRGVLAPETLASLGRWQLLPPYRSHGKLSRHSLTPKLALLFALIACSAASAQGPSTRIYGPQDQDVPVPQFAPVTGTQNAVALQAITDYLTAVSATAWPGMQATGLFSTAGTQQAGQNATLTISGGDDFRLDIVTPTGTRSIRFYGAYEEIQQPNGTREPIPPVAAEAGLLAFPKLLAPAFTSTTTILDQGMVTVSGQSLHRITLEQPLYPSSTPSSTSGAAPSAASSRYTSVMDLYFDAATHLLVKSAIAVPISSTNREIFLKVMTYSNYQVANGVLIPFTNSLTIDGQPQWTLQLTSVQPLPSLPGSYFHF